MFMTDVEREMVDETLNSYKKWAYDDCEYSEKEAKFIVVSEIDLKIKELQEEVKILEIVRQKIKNEGL